MKKIAFIEAIKERLPVNVNPKVVDFYISRAMNQILYETFRKNVTGIDIYSKTYKSEPVLHDADMDIYYTELPVTIVQLPISGDGILSIHSLKGNGIEFAPKRAGMENIHDGMEVKSLDGPIPYWLMDNRIEYGYKPMIEDIDNVRIRLIPDFKELDMLDDLYIPVGMDERVIELVTQFATGVPPRKEINDQNNRT